MKRNHDTGFATLSLVMSLVVVALIVFLAFAYLTMQRGGEVGSGVSPIQRARSVECLAQIRKIEMQMQLYSVQHVGYPESLGMLEGLSESDLRCPITHSYYLYDSQSGRITCPDHRR